MSGDVLEEVPGLYGNLRLREKVLQRIWNESAFLTQDLKTDCGQSLSIKQSGEWNLAREGPDFRAATIFLDGVEQEGDVEVHFYPKDWNMHGHQSDPNYNQVILHVCLYPSQTDGLTPSTLKGRAIPQLTLLPFLTQGLEQYCEEFALASLHGTRDPLVSFVPSASLTQNIIKYSQQRWCEKLKFAKFRLKNLGWDQACHQWFLEVLGYPRNRRNMHQLALLHPLPEWGKLDVDRTYDVVGDWKIRGVRPLNRPLHRLHQYQELMRTSPSWTNSLKSLNLPKECLLEEESVGSLSVSTYRKDIKVNLLGNIFSDSKTNTLVVDCLLPLWAAYHEEDPFALWYYWPSGDFPARLVMLAKKWELKAQGKAVENGVMQGLLQHFLLDHTMIRHQG